MATYDFRILLENIDGAKTSYYSSSFVDTSVDLVLSASQVFARITGSVSCSYQNTSFFSQSEEPTTNDINTSFVFKDNNLLSASLTGSLDTGAIEFISLNTEYDRLLRYKFYGEKVCSTLGLPNNQWVYVDQMRLPADSQANYFEGNVNAKSIYVSDNLSFSNQSTIDSDIPFNIDTGSDRHIKFIDNRALPTPGLYMGYDKDNDVYEIGGEKGNFEIHSGSLVETTEIHKLSIISGSNTAGTINMRTSGIKIEAGSGQEAPSIELLNPDRSKNFKFEIFGGSGTGRISMQGGTGDIEIRTQGFGDAIYIDNSEDRVGIGTDEPEATLHVVGDLKTNSHISASGDISASDGIILGGTRRTTWPASSAGQWYDGTTYQSSSIDIYVDGNITASGDVYIDEYIYHNGDTDTKIGFPQGDKIDIIAGGINFIQPWQKDSVEDRIVFNVDEQPMQFRFSTDQNSPGLYITGSGDVGIHGIDIPSASLHVGGNIWAESHITASGNISASGNLTVGEWIYHGGETAGHTGIRMTDQRIRIRAGDISYLDMDDSTSAPHNMEVNAGGNNLDFKIRGQSDNPLFKTDASTDRIGTNGRGTPLADFHIGGNLWTDSHITASGDISSSGNVYATLPGYHVLGGNFADATEKFLGFGPSGTTYSEDEDTDIQDTRIIAAFDGYIHSVILKAQAAPGSSTVQVFKATSGVDSDAADSNAIIPAITVNMSANHTPYRFSFGTTYSFVAGDTLAFKFNPSSDPNSDVDGQLILMYNVTP